MPAVIMGIVLVTAPLLFGAVYPWAYGLLEIGVLAAFLIWLFRHPPLTVPGAKPSNWGMLCLMGFVAWAGVQLIPLPRELVRLLAGPTYQLWQLDFLPSDIVHLRAFLPLTVYPFATANVGILFLVYLLAFYLAGKLVASPYRAAATPNTLILLIVLAGLAVAVIGIVQKGVNARAIYGFLKPLENNTFTGPYVNYNHFAGYLELAIPLGISLIAFSLHTNLRLPANSGLLWLCGGAVVIMASALIMSTSRGGIFSFCLVTLGQLLMITALFRQRRIKGRFVAFGLIFLLILGVGAHMTDWSQTMPRFHRLFQQDPTENIRWKLFKDILHMGDELPFSGSGLGTFAKGYPFFKTISRQGIFKHAHNDYLEILAETGWPGILLFLGFTAWVLGRGGGTLFRALSWRNRDDPTLTGRALLITGCMGGVVSLLLHGMVDSNLHIPANALTWFVLCGLTVGLSFVPIKAGSLAQPRSMRP